MRSVFHAAPRLQRLQVLDRRLRFLRAEIDNERVPRHLEARQAAILEVV
jgi:hypothetical protein